MSDQSIARALLALAEQQRVANRIALHALMRGIPLDERKQVVEDVFRQKPPTPDENDEDDTDPWAKDWPAG